MFEVFPTWRGLLERIIELKLIQKLSKRKLDVLKKLKIVNDAKNNRCVLKLNFTSKLKLKEVKYQI